MNVIINQSGNVPIISHHISNSIHHVIKRNTEPSIIIIISRNFIYGTRLPAWSWSCRVPRSEPRIIDNRDIAASRLSIRPRVDRVARGGGGGGALTRYRASGKSASWRRLQNAASFDLGPQRLPLTADNGGQDLCSNAVPLRLPLRHGSLPVSLCND